MTNNQCRIIGFFGGTTSVAFFERSGDVLGKMSGLCSVIRRFCRDLDVIGAALRELRRHP